MCEQRRTQSQNNLVDGKAVFDLQDHPNRLVYIQTNQLSQISFKSHCDVT